MDCRETRALIHGYVDGELDLVTGLEVERHIQDCTGCAHVLSDLQAVRTAIKDSAPYFEAPPDLAGSLRSSVRRTTRADRIPRMRPGHWLALAASLALMTTAGWGLVRILYAPSGDAFLTRELVASHVRSQMLPSHRFDVASADPHTVKPWFEGKLDFAPPAKDLTDQGFPLLGGRLDYLHGRPVAAIVYRRRQHTINVFVWPSSQADDAMPSKASRQGFHMRRWMGSGMTFWAVSDLNEDELQEFVRLIQR